MAIDITTGQVATLINACNFIVQHTFGLATVVLLIYVMHNSNSAITWSAVGRTLHSSLWPTLLRTDSSSAGDSGRVRLVSILASLGTVLVTAAGIVTPLGLKDGPVGFSAYKQMNASYVADISPIGLATPPRDTYSYERTCGLTLLSVACPGSGNDSHNVNIAPSIITPFASTNYGPFNMQYRVFYPFPVAPGKSLTRGDFGVAQSFVLRDDVFAIEGLIVDMTDSPGVGLWNHTIPPLKKGGTWNKDILWIEPVTACVNTNLTLDFKMGNRTKGILSDTKDFYLTDRGGIVDSPDDFPSYPENDQHPDLNTRALLGALQYNKLIANKILDPSFVGRKFTFISADVSPGKVQFPLFSFTGVPTAVSIQIHNTNSRPNPKRACEAYIGTDIANISNIGIHCFTVIGPPTRLDGGDPRIGEPDSLWTQSLHFCAAATRAKMQTITFASNGSSSLSDLRITRKDTNTPVLWAVEKTGLNITDVNPYWGVVSDIHEFDPALWTLRSKDLYIPAGSSDIIGVAGQPHGVFGVAWTSLVDPSLSIYINDYTGVSNFALLNKWRSVVYSDPVGGPGRVANWIWTDLVANNIIGNDTATSLLVSEVHPTVEYDYRFAIPASILLAFWLPIFLAAIAIISLRKVRLSFLTSLLNQTSVGRLVVGDSDLEVIDFGNERRALAPTKMLPDMDSSRFPTSIWSDTAGKTSIGYVDWKDVTESSSRRSLRDVLKSILSSPLRRRKSKWISGEETHLIGIIEKFEEFNDGVDD